MRVGPATLPMTITCEPVLPRNYHFVSRQHDLAGSNSEAARGRPPSAAEAACAALAKAYPDRQLAVALEEMHTGGAAAHRPGTGRMLSFELGTDTR